MHKSGLLDALVTLVNLVWSQAFDVIPGAAGIREMASDQIDETDARVLTLLLAGLTDQAIGGQPACHWVRCKAGSAT